VFSRDIPPVWWDYPVWILTGLLSGALIATYVSEPGAQAGREPAAEAGWEPAAEAGWEPAAEAGRDRRAEAGRQPGAEPSERTTSKAGAGPGAEFSKDAPSPGEPGRGPRSERRAAAEDRAGSEGRGSSEGRGGSMGTIGVVLGWFAVGCPVCNKIALLALGYTGALTWFAPLQPVLAVAALVLTSIALVWRLSGQVACPVPTRIHAGQGAV